MERLKAMKENLIAAAQSQMSNLSNVNAKELGEVIDMIKDLEEACYYATITKAMHEQEKEEKNRPMVFYTERPYYMYRNNPYPEERDMDRMYGRMYYSGGNSGGGYGTSGQGGSSSNQGGSRSYGGEYNMMRYPDQTNTYPGAGMRDMREGRSPLSRRNYMEAKEKHQKPEVQMKELEKYMYELSEDITEMIEDASPEEKAILQQKLNTLASKIHNK